MKIMPICNSFRFCFSFLAIAALCPTRMLADLPSAQVVASEMIVGWNLGNTLEATNGETSWGNPKATQTLIDGVKAAGFNAIRLPCAWDAHATDGVIDSTWMARVKEVVDYCINDDLYVILNIHWDNGWLEENCTESSQDEVNEKQEEYWTQIATTFKDYDEHLLFASTNEPTVSDSTGMAVLLSYHQTFIDAVRATGGNNSSRTLVIQGPTTDIVTTNKLMNTLPTDTIANRLIVEIHYYTPYQFCGLTADADWGDMFYYWGEDYHSTTDTTRNATWGEEDTVDEYFQLMKTKFVDKGIPVIIGELGAIKRSLADADNLALHLASRQYFYEYCNKIASSNGMVLFVWDHGSPNAANTFGLINRNTGAVADEGIIDALMSGISTCVSGFAPTDSLGGKWSDDWGWIDDSYFPWIYSYASNNWFYIYYGLDADVSNGYWITYYTSDFSDYGWGYVYPGIGWWKLYRNLSSEWIAF
jgi:endoglucanase